MGVEGYFLTWSLDLWRVSGLGGFMVYIFENLMRRVLRPWDKPSGRRNDSSSEVQANDISCETCRQGHWNLRTLGKIVRSGPSPNDVKEDGNCSLASSLLSSVATMIRSQRS